MSVQLCIDTGNLLQMSIKLRIINASYSFQHRCVIHLPCFFLLFFCNPRTILKSNPSELELCRNIIVTSVLIPDFFKETSSNWNFCTSVGLRLDQAKRNVFFLIAHFITLPLIHSLWWLRCNQALTVSFFREGQP